MKRRLLVHYLDHALLGAAVFVAGVLFQRCASFHHGPAARRR